MSDEQKDMIARKLMSDDLVKTHNVEFYQLKEGMLEGVLKINSRHDRAEIEIGYVKVKIKREFNKVNITICKINVESDRFEPVFCYSVDA